AARLEKQGRLAHARIAADEDERAGHYSAAEDAGELADARGDALPGGGPHLAPGDGPSAHPETRPRPPRRRRARLHPGHEVAEARGVRTGPRFRRGEPAGLAPIGHALFRHYFS